jgi:5-(aminomethyl)-3-furanmethanol phosphate kinase
MTSPLVAKVGGSLFDLPDLGSRLRIWLGAIGGRQVLFVPGGGPAADAIRILDRTHQLGDVAAHWLALRVLTVNAHFLSALLGIEVVSTPAAFSAPVVVLDGYAFCQADEGRTGALEHAWHVTSDSVAARAASVVGGELVLLKSTNLPVAMTWTEASQSGLVDEAFAKTVADNRVRVSWVNLRGADFEARR